MINHGPIDSEIPILFEPEENSDLPYGLVVSESLFSLKPGKSNVIKFRVKNITNHNIVLPKRTVLGRIQLVQSVTPLDVTLKQNVVHREQIANENFLSEVVFEDNISNHIKHINLDGLAENQK